MPLPFWLLGAGAATVLGAVGHASAKETNEQAERLMQSARATFNEAKSNLEKAHAETESQLINLAQKKTVVLNGPLKDFAKVYNRLKTCNLLESEGINELSSFSIENDEVLQIQETADIYKSAFSGGITGATTGAAVALATYGASSFTLAGGVLSLAGSAAAIGQVGIAASLTGAALSVVAAPLAVVAAPVMLFSAFSASMKADENLSKAKLACSEADEAAEKMEISATLCRDISRRSQMYGRLLEDLTGVFVPCVEMSDKVSKNIIKKHGKDVQSSSLTLEEKKLIAMLRSLAGAIKSVIDTPILNESGSLTSASANLLESVNEELPKFKKRLLLAENADYGLKRPFNSSSNKAPYTIHVRNVSNASAGKTSDFPVAPSGFLGESVISTIVGMLIASMAADFFNSPSTIWSITLAWATLPGWKRRDSSDFFGMLGKICNLAIVLTTSYFCREYLTVSVFEKGIILKTILLLIASATFYTKQCEWGKGSYKGSKMLLFQVTTSYFLISLGAPIVFILDWIGFSVKLITNLLLLIHGFVMMSSCFGDLYDDTIS